MRIGATRDGRLTALSTRAIGDSGAYAEHTHAAVKMVLELDALEVLLPQIPAVRLKGHSVYTNSIPGGCMRGIGNIQFNMALGLAVDTLAEELGLDPIDVAIGNFSHEWEAVPNESLAAVLRAGAERIGWHRRAAPDAGAGRGDAKLRGLGFSFHHAWHAAWQEAARGRVQVGIALNPDGSVILQAPQVETGVAPTRAPCWPALRRSTSSASPPTTSSGSPPPTRRPGSRTWCRPTAPRPTCTPR